MQNTIIEIEGLQEFRKNEAFKYMSFMGLLGQCIPLTLGPGPRSLGELLRWNEKLQPNEFLKYSASSFPTLN